MIIQTNKKRTFYEKIKVNNKIFPVRIWKGTNPQFLFITHHGIMSDMKSWIYFEKWIGDRAIIVNFDARVNGENKMKASRMLGTYTRDLRDVTLYAKKRFPKLRTILLGSSWGATVVLDCLRKNRNLVNKAIAWSIPMRITPKNDDYPSKNNLKKDKKTVAFKETSNWGYFFKLLLMLLFNFNTKSYTNIDIEKITENKMIHRFQKLTINSTPVKLFWIAFKYVLVTPKNFRKINSIFSQEKLLYIQSTKDHYLTEKGIKNVRSHHGQGIKYIELNEAGHAFQWEKTNDLHYRVFEKVWNFIND